MGLSVSVSRGAGDRAGTIARMCLALMFSIVCFESVSSEPVLLCVFCSLLGVRMFSAGPPTGWEGVDVSYLQLTGARDLNAGR